MRQAWVIIRKTAGGNEAAHGLHKTFADAKGKAKSGEKIEPVTWGVATEYLPEKAIDFLLSIWDAKRKKKWRRNRRHYRT